MNLRRFHSLSIALLWLLIAYPQWILAAEVFRWIDKDGQVYYSDQVPPRYSKYSRSELNKSGMTVKVIEGAKSREQIAKENQLKSLRKEKQRLLVKQREHDSALLRTFRNQAEIRETLAGKLSTVDLLIHITNSIIQKFQSQLKKQEKKAAYFEKNGKPLPKKLLKQIDTTRKQIANNKEKIKLQELEKQRLSKKYENDIERFAELVNQHTKKKSLVKNNFGKGISLFRCLNKSACDSAWQDALSYVEKFATTKITINNDKIIYTADPIIDSDISLSVSKLLNKNQGYGQLFLDIRCKRSSIGEELCASKKVEHIREGFKPYIEMRKTL